MPENEHTTFESALASAATSDAVFRALERLVRETVGVRLFTVMVVDTEAMLARRAYSSHPADYPVSGTKPIEPNDWYRHVVENRNVFSANTATGIADVFPDHALIASLGCGAVINLPVVREDRVAATINLLDAEGAYLPSVVTRATEILTRPAERALARIDEIQS